MTRRPHTALALLAMLLAAPAVARAQAAPDSSAQAAPAVAPATAAPSTTSPAPPTAVSVLGDQSPVPSRPHLVHVRDEATVRAERDSMAALAARSDRDVLETQKRQVAAKAVVDVKKREIDLLSSKIKSARQAKDDATRQSLEGERKRQEGMREFFEKLQDVADADAGEAAAMLDWAKARVHQCDLELQLVGRADVAAYDADPTVFRTEQEFLSATKARAQAASKLADRVQNTVDKKLRAYAQWADYLAGR